MAASEDLVRLRDEARTLPDRARAELINELLLEISDPGCVVLMSRISSNAARVGAELARARDREFTAARKAGWL